MLTTFFGSRFWQRQPTWAWEQSFVAIYLGVVTCLSVDGSDLRHTLGQAVAAVAVWLTFGHMSIASRLEEAQAHADVVTVDCYRKLTVYLVGKEVVWLAAFSLLGAWTALAGIPLFLLYPAWRRFYRRHRAVRR